MNNQNSGNNVRPINASVPQFLNIASASQRTIGAQNIRPAGTIRTNNAEFPNRPIQNVANPPIAHAQGAINLTITNGAVNLRGRSPAVSIRQDALQSNQVLTASISGTGSLQRIPFVTQQSSSQAQAINLKLAQNPINLRLTGQHVNLLQNANKSGASLLGQRPLLINAAQFSSIQGGIPVMQAVPQSVAGQFLQPANLTLLQQTGKLNAHNMRVTGKVPLRSLHSGASVSHRNLPTILQKATTSTIGKGSVTVTALPHGQGIPIQVRPVTPISAHSKMPIFFTAASPTTNPVMSPPLTLRMSSTSQQQHEQLMATDLSTKSPPGPVSGSQLEREQRLRDELRDDSTKLNAIDLSGVAAAATKVKPSDGEIDKGSEKDTSMTFDVESSLQWKDGVGFLAGSDIKFHKNEFGILEMIDDESPNSEPTQHTQTNYTGIEQKPRQIFPKHESTSTSPKGGLSISIARCKQCGIHAPVNNFLNGGNFCTKRCLCLHNCKVGRLKRSDSLNLETGKKKKRKISEYDVEETLPKVAKVRYTEDGERQVIESPQKKEISLPSLKTKIIVPSLGKKSKFFEWNSYMKKEGGVPAPAICFKEFQIVPDVKNGFKISMKLEAIDPRHPSHYCVVTVVEIRGQRIRLHFDGYSETYDFWTNANSPFIFPIGWTEKIGKYLDPPKDYVSKQQLFDWSTYMRREKATAAPKSLFQTTSPASVTPHGFRIGMKLEAVDKKNSSLICVATIVDVLGDNVLIHFDGWEDIYDYWCDPGSPHIHPVGWCQKNGVPLSPPRDCENVDTFTWESYLMSEKHVAVPTRAFKPRQPNNFEVGQHLEIVDKRNPGLIRAASIVEVESYCIKVHFCGWSEQYDYWMDDDSPDMHPCDWCSKTGHPLTHPITMRDLAEKSDGCPTLGCTGVGHVKGAKFVGHHSAFGCPYSQFNMNKESCLLDRLVNNKPEVENGLKKIKDEPADESSIISPTEKTIEKKSSRASPLGFDMVRNATPSQMEKARELLELQEKRGVPLFGKGSGRGRKKTIVRLIRELQELKTKSDVPADALLKATFSSSAPPPLSVFDNKDRPSVQGIHMSVFSPPPALHPYHDLPLGWQQSSTLLHSLQGLSADDVTKWDHTRVLSFVTSLTGSDRCASVFEEQQIDGESFMMLNQADMIRSMNIKLGPAIKLHNSILILKNNVPV